MSFWSALWATLFGSKEPVVAPRRVTLRARQLRCNDTPELFQRRGYAGHLAQIVAEDGTVLVETVGQTDAEALGHAMIYMHRHPNCFQVDALVLEDME